jgi:hypothetical protein
VKVLLFWSENYLLPKLALLQTSTISSLFLSRNKCTFHEMDKHLTFHVKWLPLSVMVHHRIMDTAEGLQVWSVFADTVNKQPWTDGQQWSSRLVSGEGTNHINQLGIFENL